METLTHLLKHLKTYQMKNLLFKKFQPFIMWQLRRGRSEPDFAAQTFNR